MKKYKVGGMITSLDELAKQEGVYWRLGGNNEYKYLHAGWFRSLQLQYIIMEMWKMHFFYAIKLEDKNENR